MPTIRDFDQMLKAALELKDLAQKFIDFAKVQGAGEGGEGEEDLEEAPEPEEDGGLNDTEEPEEEEEKKKKPNPKHLAIILALKKKMGK